MIDSGVEKGAEIVRLLNDMRDYDRSVPKRRFEKS